MSATVARGAPPRTEDSRRPGRHEPAIIREYGTSQAEPIRAIDADALAALPLPAGSMGPKADACVRFTRASVHPAAIGRLPDATDVLAGHAGTTITLSCTADPSGAEQR